MFMNDRYNIVSELKEKIDGLEYSINRLRMDLSKEANELSELGNQMQAIKSLYDMKRLSVMQMTRKIDDKNRILNEAKNAYNKIMINTSKLIDAIGNETNNNNYYY